jgi:hypothetical protein
MPNAHEYMSDSIMWAVSRGVSGFSARKEAAQKIRFPYGIVRPLALGHADVIRQPVCARHKNERSKAALFFNFKVEYRFRQGPWFAVRIAFAQGEVRMFSALKVLRRARLAVGLGSRFVAVFFAASFLVPLVSADDVLKCVGKDGAQLYSNVRCPPGTESVVVVRQDTQNAKPTSLPNPGGNPVSRQDRPMTGSSTASTTSEPSAAKPEPLIEAPPPSLEGEPRVGMSRMQVQAIWGEPMEVSHEEVVSGRVDTWSYGDSRSLEFENGRLSAIHK